VAIAGEKGAVWLSVVSQTTCACIFLHWLDEAMDGSYHLTSDPPTSGGGLLKRETRSW